MRYIYTALFYLILPAVMLRLLWRAIRLPDYARRWGERLGIFTYVKHLSTTPTIWIHAVSLGETLAATPLIKALQKKYPDTAFVITTMTPTGSKQVLATFKDSAFHVYVPYDIPGPIHRFLDKIQPNLLIIIETELWPNLLHYTAARNIPIVLANARLSGRSARGYQRVSGITQEMLRHISLLMVQTQTEAERFTQLGMPPERLKVTGNIKFDITVSEQQIIEAGKLRQTWGAERPVWIAASTHPSEEKIVLAAFKEILTREPQTLLILVPRHPERRHEVQQLCEQAGYNTVLRSAHTPVTSDTAVFMIDTIGELMLFYAAADVAFVGGSFITLGGHNLLEPAVLGLPILTGPNMCNFAEITDRLLNAGAAFTVTNAEELAKKTLPFLQASEQPKITGEKGRQVVFNNRGALPAHIDAISRILEN
jgi:3-deoxy-D-manno-octulosonic-acid transferase